MMFIQWEVSKWRILFPGTIIMEWIRGPVCRSWRWSCYRIKRYPLSLSLSPRQTPDLRKQKWLSKCNCRRDGTQNICSAQFPGLLGDFQCQVWKWRFFKGNHISSWSQPHTKVLRELPATQAASKIHGKMRIMKKLGTSFHLNGNKDKRMF